VALEGPDAGPPLRQLATTLLAVNRRHERLIDGLLTLAGSEERIVDPTPVDLADVARHVTTEAGDEAVAAGIDIRTDLKPTEVIGDPVLLERLVQNLIDNAIRYNRPEAGRITVTTGTVDGTAQVTVDNTGPPVPAYEIPGLFEPFHRLSTSDRGTGLGLSIVRSVARAHGGEAEATPGPDGGLTVRVVLPTGG
jgi:signal transduction histidine kinase